MASSGWKYVLKQIGLIVLVILLALLFLAVGLCWVIVFLVTESMLTLFYRWINGKILLENF